MKPITVDLTPNAWMPSGKTLQDKVMYNLLNYAFELWNVNFLWNFLALYAYCCYWIIDVTLVNLPLDKLAIVRNLTSFWYLIKWLDTTLNVSLIPLKFPSINRIVQSEKWKRNRSCLWNERKGKTRNGVIVSRRNGVTAWWYLVTIDFPENKSTFRQTNDLFHIKCLRKWRK